MSRGFVKEDDQEETPIVPPRADLPEGVVNYVTQGGMGELLNENKN
jgi:transcription elongation factor GreB